MLSNPRLTLLHPCAALPSPAQVFTVEMHHKRVDKAGPGDNVGMNIKGLDKGNMPRTGDVMILKSDATLKQVKDFTAQIQTLDIPGEVKAGYSPIGFVRCGRSACRITGINWKVRRGGCASGSCLAVCRRCTLVRSCAAASFVAACLLLPHLSPHPAWPRSPGFPAGGQGDWRQEAGGPPQPQGQRDGGGCV